jgi:hypothetical protein
MLRVRHVASHRHGAGPRRAAFTRTENRLLATLRGNDPSCPWGQVRGFRDARMVVELSAWDVLRVAPEVVRSFEAGPEGLDVICIGGRKPKGGDTERFEDFWD